MKVFLHTNVLVSAFGARGLCADLFRYLLVEHEILTGETNITELTRTLLEKFGASVEQTREVESQLREHMVVPRPDIFPIRVRDPDDAIVLSAAIAGAADMLVTGDKDLLSVASKAPLPILTPRQAWDSLRQPRTGRN